MAEMTVGQEHIRGLLPPGPIWEPVEGGDFDRLLLGLGENIDDFREFLRNLEMARDGEGKLTDIELAHVDGTRRSELVRVILRFTPRHAWAGLRIAFV